MRSAPEMSKLSGLGFQNGTPGSPRLLELRPAKRDHVEWLALAQSDEQPEPSRGSWSQLLHNAGRLAHSVLSRIFSLQQRIETAFLASGAAAELADAALEGEPTKQLAGRIATMARELTHSVGAAVHLRGEGKLTSLACVGEACADELADRAIATGRVEWKERCASVPLRVREQIVGALSIKFDGGLRDLRPLRPLLARAGAVLAAAERESRKDRFLSLAAHELKTPLTSIKGFSYSLARRLERGEPCDPRHVHVLERQAERLHGLLEEMLEVSRIETSRFTLHQEPCELSELIDASRRSLRRLNQDEGVTAQIIESALPLFADRERIERTLTAMVLRAKTQGTPTIEATQVRGRAEVRVSWVGEPLANPEKALDARWEAPPGERQGLGMALSVGRRAAELHGGSLEAEPNAFVLILPMRVPSLEVRGKGGMRVLVVDDDEALARMMAEFLAEHDFTTDWAGGGREALEKVKASPPAILVLDLRMPDLDGRALLSSVRAHGHSPRVVLFSADREVAAAARELACEAFVEKPFAPENLLLAVQRVFALKELK
jgi:signal transduction histidine kinase